MLQWIRSLTFIVLATVYMPLLGLLYAPWAMFSRRGAYAACKAYAAGTMWMAKVIVGLRCEVTLDCFLWMGSFEVEVIEFLFVVFRVVFVRSVPMARTHRCTRVDNYQ